MRFIDVKYIPKKKIKKLLMTLESFVLHYLIPEGVKGMIVLFDGSIYFAFGVPFVELQLSDQVLTACRNEQAGPAL